MSSNAFPPPVRRRRKRPPLVSYVPFFLFCLFSLAILGGIAFLAIHVVSSSIANEAAPRATRTATVTPGQQLSSPVTTRAAVAAVITPTDTSVAHTPAATTTIPVADGTGSAGTSTPLVAATLPAPASPTATEQMSAMPNGTSTPTLDVQLTPGGPLPTRTPRPTDTPSPTGTPTGNAAVVVARDVDANGKPVKAAARFLSPATRLYAVATVGTVSPSDVLRFVFERNGVVLPRDVITYTAGGDASSHTFSAYADYANGTQPLPHGQYVVLFYRNGNLEAETPFQVG